jgi:transposase
MSSTLIIGIDVSSQSNSVFIIDGDGNPLTKKAFTTNNDVDGTSKIISEAVSHAANIGASTIKFGMEATSHYAWHLQLLILSSAELAPFKSLVYVINPSVVKGFKNAFTHLPKTDNIDAMIIAECVRFGKVKPTPLPDFRYAALQRLTRFRCSLVTTIINEKNRALNLIYLKFSSYTQDCPFSDVFGKASTALIENYTPDQIAKIPLNELIDFIVANGNNRLKNPEELALKVQKAARRAYRLNSKMSDSVDLSLSMTLENIRFLESQLSKLDKEISRQLKGFKQTITTIPGIGDVITAGIIAEVCEPSRFNDDCALAKYAGLVWNKYQSGNFCGEDTSLAKCGNQYLRYYLVEAANLVRMHTTEFEAFYTKKYKEVTKHQHKRALVLTARKLLRLVFAMLRKGQIYLEGGNAV